MEAIRICYHINKCILGGWFILSFFSGGFVGTPNLLQTLDIAVHVVYIVEHYPI